MSAKSSSSSSDAEDSAQDQDKAIAQEAAMSVAESTGQASGILYSSDRMMHRKASPSSAYIPHS